MKTMKKQKHDVDVPIPMTCTTGQTEESAKLDSEMSKFNSKETLLSSAEPEISKISQVTVTGGDGDGDSVKISIGIESNDEDYSVKAVITNDLILRTIFQNATLKDLKSYRGVNPLWKYEATKMLRKKFLTCPIRFEPAGSGGRATLCNMIGCCCCCMSRQWMDKHRVTDTLGGFSHLVENSTGKLFPCNNFEFSSSIVSASTFHKFVDEHGAHVKALQLDLVPFKAGRGREGAELFEDLLLQQLPNLNQLSVHRISEEWGAQYEKDLQLFSCISGEEGQVSRLQRLKTLDLTSRYLRLIPKAFLSSILKVAPNLETLHCDTQKFDNLTILLQLNVIHLLKKFDFEFNNDRNRTELYRLIAEQKPAFEVIKDVKLNENLVSDISPWEMSSNSVGEILSKVFDSSSKTLKSIKLLFPLGLIPGLKLPYFPNLVEFAYGDDCEEWSWNADRNDERIFSADPAGIPIFPRGSSLAVQWPHLSKVGIWFDVNIRETYNLTEIFSFDVVPHLSVREIIIAFDQGEERGLPTSWLRYFARLFPHLQIADFRNFEDFPSATQWLWSLRYLEILMFSIHVENQVRPFPDIESAFTGFTPETCLKLYSLSSKKECQAMPLEEIKKLRVGPSILNLKRLKILCIDFFSLCTDDVDVDSEAGTGGNSERSESEDEGELEYLPPRALNTRAGKVSKDQDQTTNQTVGTSSEDEDEKVGADEEDEDGEGEKDDKVLSHVSYVLALKMCPDLQLIFNII